MQAKRHLCNDLLHKCLMLVTLNQPKSNLFAGNSDTPKGAPRKASSLSLLARTDVFFTIPVRGTKSKNPKANCVRFRILLVTRTGLEPMLPP